MKKVKIRENCDVGSRNDTTLLETEVAAAAGCRHADDNVIHQLELEDSAGFKNSSGKAHIRFGRGRLP